jgi:hypothetical protein
MNNKPYYCVSRVITQTVPLETSLKIISRGQKSDCFWVGDPTQSIMLIFIKLANKDVWFN